MKDFFGVAKAKKAYARQLRDREKAHRKWYRSIQKEVDNSIMKSAENGSFSTMLGWYDDEDVAKEVAEIAKAMGYTAEVEIRKRPGRDSQWAVPVSWKLDVPDDLPKATLRPTRKWYQFWK